MQVAAFIAASLFSAGRILAMLARDKCACMLFCVFLFGVTTAVAQTAPGAIAAPGPIVAPSSFNTDIMVQKCLEGAKSAGAEVKLYQISDLKNIKTCESCLQCKRSDHKFDGRCVLRDDLAPILKELKTADAIVVGSPIYWGFMSAAIHPVLERMWFSNYVYNKDKSSVFGKKIKVGFIFTMNVDKKACDQMYPALFDRINFNNKYIFGDSEILPVYNTLQVKDYSQYDMSVFNLEQKYKDSRELFPKELQQAYELGQRLVS